MMQRPRIELVPVFVRSVGDDAIELARSCGIVLDEWQEWVVRAMLGLRADGLFAAKRVGLNIPRQNGKGVLLEVRELAGIFLLGERLINHSAHVQDTSSDHQRRLMEAMEEGGLHSQLKAQGGYMKKNGAESFNFLSGQQIRFRTRSKGAGRGFAGDCVVFDEAMFLPDVAMNALVPTLSTKKNPQIVFAGSAVDQEVMEHGVVWAKVREDAIKGEDEQLAYFEWSAPYDSPDDVPGELDLERVLKSNPALDIRISREYVAMEHKALTPRGFAVEREGVGDWPRTDGVEQTVLPVEAWQALEDPGSEVLDPVVFAFDVGPDRYAAVAVAGKRSDGLWHVEIAAHRRGTSWLPGWLVERSARHEPAEIVCDGYGPVASVLARVEDEDVVVRTITAAEHAQACGRLVDAIAERTLRHLGQEELLAAVKGAKPRPLGDAFAWSRKNSSVDICPLVAATLALSAAMDQVDGGGLDIF